MKLMFAPFGVDICSFKQFRCLPITFVKTANYLKDKQKARLILKAGNKSVTNGLFYRLWRAFLGAKVAIYFQLTKKTARNLITNSVTAIVEATLL